MVFERTRGVKQYPLHEDVFGYYPDPNASKIAIDGVIEKGITSALETLGESPMAKPIRPRLFHYTLNSFNDPIAVFSVLDMLVKWQRGAYIRPQYMLAPLRTEHPHIYWTVITVGRICAALATVCADAYWASADPFVEAPKYVPFAKGRDSRGTYEVVDPQGGDEGLLWLVKARDIFLKLSEDVMLAEERGLFKDSFAHMPKPADYFSQHLGYTIRTKDSFLAQLRPGARFEMAPSPERWTADPLESAGKAINA